MAKSGYVCYCPDLRLYRYVVHDDANADGNGDVDYKFDDDELENTIASHLASDEKLKAEVMANMTGLARLQPHMFVKFDEKLDKLDVVDPKDYWKEHDKKRDAEIETSL